MNNNVMTKMPRDLTFPIGCFHKRLSFDVTTNASGFATFFLHPSSCFLSTSTAPGTNIIAFAAQSNSTNWLFSGQTAGPFLGQVGSVSAFGLDKSNVSFVSTQSPLNCQGKVTTCLYY